MSSKKIILDVDTGIDDALAILYAVKSKEIQIEGITTVFGNVSADQATRNTLQVLELADANDNIPVAMGAKKPLFREWSGPVIHVHGQNGIGDYELPEPSLQPLEEHAADFIVRQVNEQPGELTLVFVARLTNLALALAKDPSIAGKVKGLVLMGGALKTFGNVTPIAEANIYGDPEAAHRVFESGIPITMVGLDVTRKAKFQEEHLKQLMDLASPENEKMIKFIEHIIRFGIEASVKMNEGKCRLMHDPLAVGVAIDPGLVKSENHYVYIETQSRLSAGATVADLRLSRKKTETNAAVCVEVDHERFIEHFIQTVASRDERGEG
ncbi:nucleoside hydrolase [Fictibacillus gelatini]|uniref:nucleoside hydrolase n=1 Tax=Fictibacillus gelatini TaxID=225985 RepID=UPI0003F8C9F8|nr:nucleoside hydrolase [Fictibacillus gelatini]